MGRVAVEWLAGASKGWYLGSVTSWKTALGQREQRIHQYAVSYDDTQRAEHMLDDPDKRAWLLPPPNEGALWQRLPLMCVFSKRRLTEPARGELCRHAAQCNAAELRAYVAGGRRSAPWRAAPRSSNAPRRWSSTSS